MTNVVEIAADEETNLIVRSDGTLWGVGNNGEGELGLGDYNPRFYHTRLSIADIAIGTFNITASAGDHGSITPDGAFSLDYGANRKVKINYDSGYHVSDVVVDGESVGSVREYYFVNTTEGHTLAVTFAEGPPTYRITAGVTTQNGSLSPSGVTTVTEGDGLTINITPDDYHEVWDVLVDGVSVGPVSSYTFENILDNHTVDASFNQIPRWSTAVDDINAEASKIIKVANQIFSGGVDYSGEYSTWRLEKRNAYNGDLDDDFGDSGAILGTDFSERLVDFVSDGTYLYVLGSGRISGTDSFFWVQKRSLSDGALVNEFGASGQVTVDPSNGIDYVFKIRYFDNFIYILSGSNASDVAWRVEKRNVGTGSLASDFGDNGILLINPSVPADADTEYPSDLIINNEGLFVAGVDQTGGSRGQYRIEKRTSATGEAVTAFGTHGIVISDPSGLKDEINTIKYHDGFIYIAGQAEYERCYLEKRDATSGELVSGFGNNGVITEDIPGYGEGFLDLEFSETFFYTLVNDEADPYIYKYRMEKRGTETGELTVSFSNNGIIYSQKEMNYRPSEFTTENDDIWLVGDYYNDYSTWAIHYFSLENAPTPLTHTITVSKIGNGTITPSGSVTVEEGENATFTITADSGYTPLVYVDGASVGGLSSYTFTNITSNHTINAIFSLIPSVTTTTTTTTTTKPKDLSILITTTTKPSEEDLTTTVTTVFDSSSTTTTSPQESGSNTTTPSGETETNTGGGPTSLFDVVEEGFRNGVSYILGGIRAVTNPVGRLVTRIAENTPPPIAHSFPYLIFILLAILGLNFTSQAKKEITQIQKMTKMIASEKMIVEEKDNFIMLAAHYLRTPLTIISGGIDLVSSSIAQAKALEMSQNLKLLSAKIESLLVGIEKNPRLAEIQAPDAVQEKISAYTSARFFAPILAVLGIFIFSGWLFVKVGTIDINLINLIIQVLIFVLVTQFFFFQFRKWQIHNQNRKKTERIIARKKVLDEAKSEFIGRGADELASLLKNLKSATKEVGRIDETKSLTEGLTRLEKIIIKFKMLSEIQSISLSSSEDKLDLGTVIKDTLRNNEADIKAKALKVDVKTEKKILTTPDAQKTAYVVGSILDNAIKFNKDKGEVVIESNHSESHSTVIISDTGVGISKSDQEKLFQAFSKTNSALEFNQEGMGLDLYLDKIIMDSLGGSITLDSQPGRGTNVQLSFS